MTLNLPQFADFLRLQYQGFPQQGQSALEAQGLALTKPQAQQLLLDWWSEFTPIRYTTDRRKARRWRRHAACKGHTVEVRHGDPHRELKFPISLKERV